jgi:uncharacterized membrane-anchored protein YitT (DUF2179 family)
MFGENGRKTPLASATRANSLAMLALLGGLLAIAFSSFYWPLILLTVGISLSVRRMLLGFPYEAALTLLVFIGLFITLRYNLDWTAILTVALSCAAITLLFREVYGLYRHSSDWRIEEQEKEIEDEQDGR